MFSRCVFDSKRKKENKRNERFFWLDRDYPNHDNIFNMFIPSLFTLLTYLYYKKNIRKCQIIQSCGNETEYSSLKKIINIEIAQ